MSKEFPMAKQEQQAEERLEQAADWIDQIHAGDPIDSAQLDEWLQTPENKAAFELMQNTLYADDLEPLLSTASAKRSDSTTERPTAKGQSSSLNYNPQTFRYIASAASFLLLIIASWFLLWWPEQPHPPEVAQQPIAPQEFKTEVAKPKQYRLSDGTQVHLNGKSQISYSENPDSRHVSLQAGEVYFDVARDIERPFEINTKWGEITVLGTAFNVDADSNGLTVTVDEGHVQVDLQQPYDLYAGQRITLSQDGTISLEDVSEQNRHDWRDGWYSVNQLPLEQLLNQLQHYSAKEIIAEPAIRQQLLLTGRFNLHHPDQTLALISELHGIYRVETETAIYLSTE